MGASTDQIRKELTKRRRDAEHKIRVLRRRARQDTRRLLPVAAAAGGACVSAALLLALTPMLLRRRQSRSDRLRAQLTAWGRAARRSIPPAYLVVGRRPDEESRARRWTKTAMPLAEAAASAAGTAAARRLASTIARRASRPDGGRPG
jgi:uncharacterized membrane protein